MIPAPKTDQPIATVNRMYIPLKYKFLICQFLSLVWVALSVRLSLPWLHDLARVVGVVGAFIIVAGVAYVPGYLNALQVLSLLFDRQPPLKSETPTTPVTVLIAAWNEAMGIEGTLQRVHLQDYRGPIKVVLIDNNSTDQTVEVAESAARRLSMDLECIFESTPGKNHALNRGLNFVSTELVITLDADTLLHKSAIRYLVSRYHSSPSSVVAVAGAVLVRNSRQNLLTRMQEWDYFLGIASTKRLQGMYQSTLVAQGAFSLYRTDIVKEVGGWPDAIGEDIVLTWRFFKQGWHVYFEPLAVAFTDAPVKLKHFVRQRSRWARGMIEGIRDVKPWQQSTLYTKFLTGLDLLIPYTDFCYTFFWLPGLILAFFGKYWIVGPLTIFVLPLTLLSNFLLYRYQKRVFNVLDLRVRRNRLGFAAYVLLYQMMMSPISIWGYIQETMRLRRVWR